MANLEPVSLPDIGDFDSVDVIEVLVGVGDAVRAEQSLITLESDKATMEIPAPRAGTVAELKVAVGDKVSQGDVILVLEAAEQAPAPSAEPEAPAPAAAPRPEVPPAPPEPAAGEKAAQAAPIPAYKDVKSAAKAHASPSVRRFARDLGVDLSQVSGTGRKGRIAQSDVQNWVKQALNAPAAAPAAGGLQVDAPPEIDFSKFGEIDTQPLSRIQKISAKHLHRSWVTVPHVTQFDEADITELEAFRKKHKAEAAANDIKLTFLPFLLKACVSALRKYPRVNSSLAADGETLVMKQYMHIGIAVDTQDGLVVPVVRDVDKKGLFDLAEELGEISARARDGKLAPRDIQGAGFTISSLGGIGGTAFTPIINAPEVAILGVARAKMQPVWQGEDFVPRLIMPFSLSYDHRVIDGALGARFTTYLAQVLSDIRRSLL